MKRLEELEKTALEILEEVITTKNKVYVGHSGGIDSTVLYHLARRVNSNVKAYFFNTGVEEKENLKFVKSQKTITMLRPKITYKEGCYRYGFPIGSKEVATGIDEVKVASSKNVVTTYKRLIGFNGLGLNDANFEKGYSLPLWAYEAISKKVPLTSKCCNFLKKDIVKRINGFSITGEMTEESKLREQSYLTHGAIKGKKATPLHNWTKADIWSYIEKYNVEYSKFYVNETMRSGCITCFMGFQFELKATGVNRVKNKMEIENPKQYKAHMKYKHKDGMTFGEAVEIMSDIFMFPNLLEAHQMKIELILNLKKELDNSNTKYNKILLQEALTHSKKQVAKSLRYPTLFS